MKLPHSPPFLTIPQLKKITFLSHGFGTLIWKIQDFKKRPEWKNFRRISLRQIHSNVVRPVEKSFKKACQGDAMITDQPHLLLIIKTADCLPVLMVDEEKRVIATVHCGWKGTSKGVIQHVVRALERYYGCSPSSLFVAMGPHIGKECYEVGAEVIKSFEQAGLSLDSFYPHPQQKRKYFFDLKKANVFQLLSLGIKKENIFSLDFCSHCRPDFPSYRRDGKEAGRVLSFVGMSF
jgi:YfiH family protein